MKRIAPLCMALALAAGVASTAQAQLTMQMTNGWSFTFSGNVNAFFTYEKPSSNTNTITPGGIVGPQGASADGASRIRTGLLPAFAVFDAKGKEGNTDLGVHFGFAPQVNCAAGVHDCFGAQIDMRQVYLTVGGTWGQILAGRELGLYGRENILTDQTLFGIGATGGSATGTGAGTTLGRIGFGYIYPNFVAQMTYSTPAGRPGQLSIGLFEAAANGVYTKTETPRVETELTYNIGKSMVWLGGLVQNTKIPGGASGSATAWGGSGGVRLSSAGFGLVGSGYYGKGLGTTLLFDGTGVTGTGGTDGGTDGSGSLRRSYGFIGQITYSPPSSKVTIAGSYGSSYLKTSSDEEAAAGGTSSHTENTLISGGLYYQATKSLKVVAEGNYAWTKASPTVAGVVKNKTFAPALGFMLFF